MKKRFLKTLLVFAALDLVILMTGCGNWEQEASSIISLVGPAITAVLQILASLGVAVSPAIMEQFNSWAGQAQTALQTVTQLLAQYKNAEASAQPGILSAIQTALGVVSGNLSTILPELHITDANSQSHVTAALEAIMGFVAALLALLPAISPNLTIKEAMQLHSNAKASAKQFRNDFNNAVIFFGKQYQI